ncbi:MAG: hypothetical protein ACXWRE_07135 [Pseudobdellovibrionaceae bacterium]
MRYKTCFLFFVILQSGCGVELRDRDRGDEGPPLLSELKIDNETSLPIPLIQSQQVVLRYDRLVLGPKAQFITQGLNVRIEVKELIAKDSIIRTFKSDQIAEPGANGRDGGHLELIAEKATGNLTLLMQGERGGGGAEGAPPNESLRGATGAKGLDAIFSYERGLRLCVRKARDGAQGGQGLQGFVGGPGGRGGDTGSALVKITEADNFTVKIQKTPGGGGAGGQGGAGGPGGQGGEPGNESPPEYHGPRQQNYTASGPIGIPGPQGLTGALGNDGVAEKSCLQIADEDLRCE